MGDLSDFQRRQIAGTRLAAASVNKRVISLGVQCDNMYISIFSQHNYIFSYVRLLHYMFRPSMWAIIKCVWRFSRSIAWRGRGDVGGGGEISLCGFS